MNILLVEDNEHKRDKIIEFISSMCAGAQIREARSFTSGSKAIVVMPYDLIVLDISLPTYDKVGNESGGRKRMFGGREIARKIIRRVERVNIVFITQYDAFSDGGISLSFDELGGILKEECKGAFRGLIYYDSSKSAWKETLGEVIKNVASEKR